LKKNTLRLENVLEKVLKFEVVEFEWNEKIGNSIYNFFKERGRLNSLGLIAQDIRQYYPEVVEIGDDGYYQLDYNKLNAVLVEAIKEQQIIIEALGTELELLEKK
jgi:hypothetical protein